MTSVVGMDELGDDLIGRWSSLQLAVPALASPFFRPEFHQLVDQAHRAAGDPGRVRVAVITDGDGPPVSFWPFEKEASRLAVPAGQFLADHQGMVSDPNLLIDGLSLLATAGLDRYRFDHLAPDQPGFGRFVTMPVVSPQIDLSVPSWHRLEPTRRRLERDLGPVRFETTADRNTLDTVMRWKSRQYLDAGKRDIFALGWCRELVGELVSTRAEHFRGHLSALWAGDTLLAVHLGLQSGTTLHYWFPAYDPAFARYSPGTVLLLELCRHGSEAGIELVDLGKGREPYKERVANRGVLVGQGVVQRATPALRARAAARRARSVLRRARVRPSWRR